MFFRKKKALALTAPLNGRIMPMSEVPDPVFSGLMMGDGFAVDPTDGFVAAPAAGEIVTVFPTKHAIGMKNKEGIELLVHFGMNTVELGGEGITVFVEEGQTVEIGDKLMEVDIKLIRDKVPSLVTPVVVLDAKGKAFELFSTGTVTRGEKVAELK